MAEFLRRHSLLLTTFGLLIGAFQLMSLSISNRALPQIGGRAVDFVFLPFQKGYHEVFQSGKYLFRHYFFLLNVESERNELLSRVKELEAHNSRLMEYDSENKRLRSILGFSEESGFSGVVASVVGRDASNWVKSITIDRGSSDGLREGLAVVDGNAVVGQTTTVNPHSSRVLLLTDNSSAIDALAQSSRAVGTVEGGLGRSALKFRYVLKLKEFLVNVGDRVIASGQDGVFPKGSLIGVVSKVNPQASGWFQDIEVEPSVDVYRLENVLVLLPERGKPKQDIEFMNKDRTPLPNEVAAEAAERASAAQAVAEAPGGAPVKP